VVTNENKTLLRWSILKVPEEYQTIEEFFNITVIMRLNSKQGCCELLSAFVGKQRDILDQVDLNLPITTVVASFGLFLNSD
jgi:hypothetical protein